MSTSRGNSFSQDRVMFDVDVVRCEASGGGQACPSQAELVKATLPAAGDVSTGILTAKFLPFVQTEQCNMKPCPLARLDRDLTTKSSTGTA